MSLKQLLRLLYQLTRTLIGSKIGLYYLGADVVFAGQSAGQFLGVGFRRVGVVVNHQVASFDGEIFAHSSADAFKLLATTLNDFRCATDLGMRR